MNRNNLNFTSEREGKKENINNIRVKIYKPPGEKKEKHNTIFPKESGKSERFQVLIPSRNCVLGLRFGSKNKSKIERRFDVT